MTWCKGCEYGDPGCPNFKYEYEARRRAISNQYWTGYPESPDGGQPMGALNTIGFYKTENRLGTWTITNPTKSLTCTYDVFLYHNGPIGQSGAMGANAKVSHVLFCI